MSSIPNNVARVEVTIEYPENTPGIGRLSSVILFDKDDNVIYNDQDIIDNAEYRYDSENEYDLPIRQQIAEVLSARYGICPSCIEFPYEQPNN